MKSVMVIDDSEIEHILVRQMLNNLVGNEIELESAFDGNEALEKLNDVADVDIIFLDLNMPGMDGYQFLNTYCSEKIPPKIVIITSSNNQRDVHECMKYKCVKDYIVKPIRTQQLQALIAD